MMQEKLDRMNEYFTKKRSECETARAALSADDREDEAVFEKIRGNVFEIFQTVLAAGTKAKGGDEAAVREFFRQRLGQIPSGWQTALEAARQHNEPDKAKIEELKLGAVSEISAKFAQVWEENR